MYFVLVIYLDFVDINEKIFVKVFVFLNLYFCRRGYKISKMFDNSNKCYEINVK